MRTLILCFLMVGCKSQFFVYERHLPDYDADQRIEILKLSADDNSYIYKARAVDYRIPFYFKTEQKFTEGEVVVFNQIQNIK